MQMRWRMRWMPAWTCDEAGGRPLRCADQPFSCLCYLVVIVLKSCEGGMSKCPCLTNDRLCLMGFSWGKIKRKLREV
jgi:hypothetical protein